MTPKHLRAIGQRLAATQPEIYGPRGKVVRWQTALAREIGVAPVTVRSWLSGRAPIPTPVAKLITMLNEGQRAPDVT